MSVFKMSASRAVSRWFASGPVAATHLDQTPELIATGDRNPIWRANSETSTQRPPSMACAHDRAPPHRCCCFR